MRQNGTLGSWEPQRVIIFKLLDPEWPSVALSRLADSSVSSRKEGILYKSNKHSEREQHLPTRGLRYVRNYLCWWHLTDKGTKETIHNGPRVLMLLRATCFLTGPRVALLPSLSVQWE